MCLGKLTTLDMTLTQSIIIFSEKIRLGISCESSASQFCPCFEDLLLPDTVYFHFESNFHTNKLYTIKVFSIAY